MANLNEEDITTTVLALIKLAKDNIKKTKEIAVLLRQLLETAPGNSLKAKKKYVVEKVTQNEKSSNSSNSYLRRMLHCVEFEMVNEMEPGTLKESHARLILEHTKDQELQVKIYKRALDIAGTEKLEKSHIEQAKGELEASLCKHKKAADVDNDSDQNRCPTMEIGSTAKPVKKPKAKKIADEDSSLDEQPNDDNDPFGIDEAHAEEIRTNALFRKLKPHFEANTDRIAAINILRGSKNVWSICKAFSEYDKDEIDTDALVDLIDPEKDLRKVSKNGSRKSANKSKTNKSRAKTRH